MLSLYSLYLSYRRKLRGIQIQNVAFLDPFINCSKRKRAFTFADPDIDCKRYKATNLNLYLSEAKPCCESFTFTLFDRNEFTEIEQESAS